jgi:hypothetical protein
MGNQKTAWHFGIEPRGEGRNVGKVTGKMAFLLIPTIPFLRADRYHKIGRYLDNCCRVFYPLSFSLFLILYYFVLTEGQQDDCIADRH